MFFPGFIDRGYQIQGAIILDTLLNWDDGEDTQDASPFWPQQIPWVSVCLYKVMVQGQNSYPGHDDG